MNNISKVVSMLLDGRVGAIFEGYPESGSRALGHRSIIANPTLRNGKDLVNRIKNSLFEPTLNPDKIRMMMGWISKRMIRCGFELVYDKVDVWTRDLYQCYKLFSDIYPEKQDKMKLVLMKAISPTTDRNDIFEIFNEIGDWLVEEIDKKLDKNDDFNVQTLRKVQNELYKI